MYLDLFPSSFASFQLPLCTPALSQPHQPITAPPWSWEKLCLGSSPVKSLCPAPLLSLATRPPRSNPGY
uniref:Uncharacterized protein n=1 Tax=Sus scrofa TaxID=9823 RepID=A0A4X1U8T7_PIG